MTSKARVCLQPRSNSASQPPEEHPVRIEESPAPEDHIQLSPLGSDEQEVTFTEIHNELAPPEQQQEEKEQPCAEVSGISEGVGEDYALSATLPQDQENKEESSMSLQE